ncbi:hypothetical protein A5727_23110 [Mycobacterium sp. ACS4331]|nr:hypothetical protein A5727_23110 [Mycobacterium sp. ACS4331]
MLLAIVLIALVFALLFFAVAKGVSTKSKLSVGALIKLEFEFDPAQKAKVVDAAGKAAEERGESARMASKQVRTNVESLSRVRLRKVLWVDDEPDNNVYESVALIEAGCFIATATSNAAARRYLNQTQFDVVITDLGRGGDPDNGKKLVEEITAQRPHLPVVVYTINADQRRDALKAAGAAAVEDEPAALIGAVLTTLGH